MRGDEEAGQACNPFVKWACEIGMVLHAGDSNPQNVQCFEKGID